MIADVAGGPLEVRYVPAGDDAGERPALVFLHEGLGSAGLWRRFPDDVRAAVGEPAMLVYSRHGHGRSGPARLPRPVTYMHHEADVVLPQLLDRFDIARPVLVGHSDGASIALLYAGAGNPVTALVQIAPHVFVEDFSVESIAAIRDTYASTDLGDRLARHHDDAGAAFRGWNDVWLSPEFRTWNIEDRLGVISAPVLLVQGTADAYGTTAQLDAIEAGVSGRTTRVMVPGAGHSPHHDAPEVVLPAVAEFLATVV